MSRLVPLLCLLILPACAIMPRPDPGQHLYRLDAGLETAPVAAAGETLVIGTPRGHAGYETVNMAYVDRPYGLGYFSESHWVDTPGRMLAPLLTQALETSGLFKAVIQAPSPARARYRLDSELIRLHQDFTQTPSRARITLRVQLIDLASGKVIGSATLDEQARADTETAYGGVQAANRALVRLLRRLRGFCREALRPRP